MYQMSIVILSLSVIGLAIWNIRFEYLHSQVVKKLLAEFARVTEMWRVEKRWDEGYQDRMKEFDNKFLEIEKEMGEGKKESWQK